MSRPARTIAATLALLILFATASLSAQEELVTVYGETREDGLVVNRATSEHIIPVFLNGNLPQLINMEAHADIPFGTER